MERIDAETLSHWHSKIIKMDEAYKRMVRADRNSGMFVMYREQYEKCKKECDEIDDYISSSNLGGYEEYVIRLRFQECMKMERIAARLQLDVSNDFGKSPRTVYRILKSALAKLGITPTGKNKLSPYEKKIRKQQREQEKAQEAEETPLEQREELVGTSEHAKEEIATKKEIEPLCGVSDCEEECYDSPRDEYGNVVFYNPFEEHLTEEDVKSELDL